MSYNEANIQSQYSYYIGLASILIMAVFGIITISNFCKVDKSDAERVRYKKNKFKSLIGLISAFIMLLASTNYYETVCKPILYQHAKQSIEKEQANLENLKVKQIKLITQKADQSTINKSKNEILKQENKIADERAKLQTKYQGND